MAQLLFPFSLFLSALLLFLIQPMIAKMMLPVYGGSPAVWTTCMLFFQSLLLLSYGYVWWLCRLTYWRLFHTGLAFLSLIAWPFIFTSSFERGAPDLLILKYLISQLGLPLLVIAASAPLLQFAYSQTGSKKARDPYFLYATSNVGSLLALLAYPGFIERYSGLSQQFQNWNRGFLVYLACLFLVFFVVPYRNQPVLSSAHIAKAASLTQVFLWLAYSFIPCSLMLGVSFYISTDIAATPLFWVIPLALYLLTFIISFAQKPLISLAWLKRNILFFISFSALAFIIGPQRLRAWELLLAHLTSFFMLALLCHGNLVRLRPSVNQLPAFYFYLALGGMLAGIFNGILAPRIFSDSYEYPLIFLLAMLCLPLPKQQKINAVPLLILFLLLSNYFLITKGWLPGLKDFPLLEIFSLILLLIWPGSRLSFFIGMSLLFIFIFSSGLTNSQTLIKQRNFYGVKQVVSLGGAHVLMSQNTVHGFQIKAKPEYGSTNIAYYNPPFKVIQRLQSEHPLHIAIIGLGTGMMSCQAREGDVVKMIDIDKQVIDIASNVRFFTYLRDCPPQKIVIEGDGRLVLQNEADSRNDLVILDAFSSDAIPMHLLTLEAFQLYKQKITADGAILTNISNRHLQLLPVLTAAGRQLELLVLHKLDPGNINAEQFPSEWVLLTANEKLAKDLMQNDDWQIVTGNNKLLWTDNYSNLIPLFKW